MRPHVIIVVPPRGDDLASFPETQEDVLIEALIAKFAVEALDESVVHRFAGLDVVPGDPIDCLLYTSFSRECLTLVVDTSLGGVRVVRELERLALERATPQVIVSDNGTELTSGAVLRWAIDLSLIHISNAFSNAFDE